METLQITIVYHSGFGHTKQVAMLLAETMRQRSNAVSVKLLNVLEAIDNPDILHASDTIVFGTPTYFGNVSAEFKKFMESTGGFWFKQAWKDKLAAGFTNSSSTNGDKLATLNALSLFAAQHSMIWVSQGILPRYICDQQTDGQNRLASYLGLMTQSDNNLTDVKAMHSGDILTAEMFAQRIVDVTLSLKGQKATAT